MDREEEKSGRSTVNDDCEGRVICGSSVEIVVGKPSVSGGMVGRFEPEGSSVIVGRLGLSVMCGEVSRSTEIEVIERLTKGEVDKDGDAVISSIGLVLNPEVMASTSDDPRIEVGTSGKLKVLLNELSVGNIDPSNVVGNDGTLPRLGPDSPVNKSLGNDGSVDALKIPVVKTVTVNGGGIQVTVTAPSQTVYRSVPRW